MAVGVNDTALLGQSQLCCSVRMASPGLQVALITFVQLSVAQFGHILASLFVYSDPDATIIPSAPLLL